VQYIVYPLRKYGERVPDEMARADAKTGRLKIWNGRRVNAQVYDRDDRALLNTLNDVRILSFDDRGMLLTGTVIDIIGRSGETKSVCSKQTWWCVPA